MGRGRRGGLQPPILWGQQEKIWAKPVFKDVFMFFFTIIIIVIILFFIFFFILILHVF